MVNGGIIGSAALAWMLAIGLAPAGADDLSRHPDFRGQWTRIGSAQYDPSKGGGLAQQVPFNAEYQAIFEGILKNRATGGLENNWTATCLPSGMPRIMIVYETMEVIVTAETTFIRGSYMNELRRIFTDGRAWPKDIRPSFRGYSIGQWLDEDKDGKFDMLTVETRGFKGPRTYDGTGTPFHSDNQTVVTERIYLDKADPDKLHDDITVVDHALTRPWTVNREYRRQHQPFWSEFVCEEGNQQVYLGKDNYMISSDGFLMPVQKDQPAPDLRYFKKSQ
jgi:hypothetical protein